MGKALNHHQSFPLLSHRVKITLGDLGNGLPQPILPSNRQLFAPRGAYLSSINSPLWIADTGHHRLLGWEKLPTQDNQPANWVIGQVDFESEGQNGKRNPNGNSFNVPTGICRYGQGLAVADAWNHRVLIWNNIPTDSHVPADLVLGQRDFESVKPNQGLVYPNAQSFDRCHGVFVYENKLFVADTGNRRVLIWHQLPTENNQPADVVLGQPDMVSKDENCGQNPSSLGMRWCHDITIWQGNLVVVDAGNNRVMIWRGIPSTNFTPCDFVLGQNQFDQVEINQGKYFPTADSLSIPYGVDCLNHWLLVADAGNSRILGWNGTNFDFARVNYLEHGKPADGIAGQEIYTSKSENRDFGLPKRDSFNWCSSIQICDGLAVICDSGNNRVVIWEITGN